MLDTVSYTMLHLDPRNGQGMRVEVHGVQVGRFAVRQSDPGDSGYEHADPAKGRFLMRRFVVEHIPSGLQAAHFDDFRDAMVFADDVSRYCVADPDGTEPANVIAQMGPAVYDWLQACNAQNIAIPFRRWQGRDFDRELAQERGL